MASQLNNAPVMFVKPKSKHPKPTVPGRFVQKSKDGGAIQVCIPNQEICILVAVRLQKP